MKVVGYKCCNNIFISIILLSTFFSGQVFSSDNLPSSFKDYVPYILGDEYDFGTLYLAPELSKNILKNIPEQKLYPRLSIPTKNNKINISFDPGMSDDPTFIVQVNNAKEISYIRDRKSVV